MERGCNWGSHAQENENICLHDVHPEKQPGQVLHPPGQTAGVLADEHHKQGSRQDMTQPDVIIQLIWWATTVIPARKT